MNANADTLRKVTEQIRQAGGANLEVVELEAANKRKGLLTSGIVRIGVSRSPEYSTLHQERSDEFDILLCLDANAPRPWVGLSASLELTQTIQEIEQTIRKCPVASMTLAQVLRANEQLSTENAFVIESFAYSMLLVSNEHKEWKSKAKIRPLKSNDFQRVKTSKEGRTLFITLSRPKDRNAFDSRMRDELCEAFEFAALDPDHSEVILAGEGATFSIGGDLNEFGMATDAGVAHLIRALRSPAQRLFSIRNRVTARLHGPCIGAGIEIPAAARKVHAQSKASFKLPEVSMGLIPGAGGTVTISSRIGRHRTCFMALTGKTIDLETALNWELVDQIAP